MSTDHDLMKRGRRAPRYLSWHPPRCVQTRRFLPRQRAARPYRPGAARGVHRSSGWLRPPVAIPVEAQTVFPPDAVWVANDLGEGLNVKSTLKTVSECHYGSWKPARNGCKRVHMGNVGLIEEFTSFSSCCSHHCQSCCSDSYSFRLIYQTVSG